MDFFQKYLKNHIEKIKKIDVFDFDKKYFDYVLYRN